MEEKAEMVLMKTLVAKVGGQWYYNGADAVDYDWEFS